MQMVLGILSFSSLLLKRRWEIPKRAWKIFLLDISKQAAQAFWAHTLNVILAVYLKLAVNKGNGCEWYFVNFSSDIFIVLALTLMIFQVVDWFATKYDILVLKSGVYLNMHDAQYIYRYTYKDLEKHINYKIYFLQLIVWLMIFTIAKLCVFWVVYENAEVLINGAIYILSVFKGHANLELFFIMMIYPFILNCCQYWVQDHFLKGTEYIEEAKRNSRKNMQETETLHIMQNGFIDFQKNRDEYRKNRGFPEKDLSAQEMESRIEEKNVEDEFILVNSKIEYKRRMSIARQVNEGEMGVRDEDYDKDGMYDQQK